MDPVIINIREDDPQIRQMSKQFNIPITQNSLVFPGFLGSGLIRFEQLPYGIHLHHYSYNLKFPIAVKGVNNIENGMYMLQINLSNRLLEKRIANQTKQLSAGGGCGAVFYSPGYNSFGQAEINQDYEVLFVSIPQSSWRQLKQSDLKYSNVISDGLFYYYDELTEENEISLRQCLEDLSQYANTLALHGNLLLVLDSILNQFIARSVGTNTKLNQTDVERQFQIKEILDNSVYGTAPLLSDLARQVHISQTKLKTDFKALFGKSIYQYYLHTKMLLAKKLILKNRLSISEISHELGYSNPSQFAAQFKKQFGQSPSAILKSV